VFGAESVRGANDPREENRLRLSNMCAKNEKCRFRDAIFSAVDAFEVDTKWQKNAQVTSHDAIYMDA